MMNGNFESGGSSRAWKRNQNVEGENEDNNDLVVIGYEARLFAADEQADYVAEERHLIPWNGDGSLKVDRYDCRLHLTSLDNIGPGPSTATDNDEFSNEQMEEELANDERYRELFVDIARVAAIEEVEREERRKAEVAFDYETAPALVVKEESSDSEDEPYELPVNIKLPVGLTLPPNLKQSHIIERTALFVVQKGPQMEVVIKAKQGKGNNSHMFGFLDFDNILNPYYKYMMKMIREGKYQPDLTKREKKTNGKENKKSAVKKEVDDDVKKPINALAALAQQHGSDSDDSDSDCELHPSLLRRREISPDIVETDNAEGPRQRPVTPEPEPITAIRKDYDVNTSNDMYSSLFKSISLVSYETELEKQKTEQAKQDEMKNIEEGEELDEEYRAWWMSFYGTPCPYSCPAPMVPPPPDIIPVVHSYAEFVAENGAEAEFALKKRSDLKLHFMDVNSPLFSYYHHRVRYIQWEMEQNNAQKKAMSTVPPPPADSRSSSVSATATPPCSTADSVVSEQEPGPSSPHLFLMTDPPPPPPGTPMNRKQRRRLQDAQRVGPAPPPGVIDPLRGVTQELLKVHSSPAILSVNGVPPCQLPAVSTTQNSPGLVLSPTLAVSSPRPIPPPVVTSAPVAIKPFVPASGPISFSLSVNKDDTRPQLTTPVLGSGDYEMDELDELLDAASAKASTSVASQSPSNSLPEKLPAFAGVSSPAQTTVSESQVDRKEKARLFMEKLLNEKRRKAKEAEEEKKRKEVAELERKKAEIEKQLAEAKGDVERKVDKKKSSSANNVSLDRQIDSLISSRIENLLASNGLTGSKDEDSQKSDSEHSVEDEKETKKKRKKEKKEKKKSKKHKKEHRKRSRSRSRSRSKDRKRYRDH